MVDFQQCGHTCHSIGGIEAVNYFTCQGANFRAVSYSGPGCVHSVKYVLGGRFAAQEGKTGTPAAAPAKIAETLRLMHGTAAARHHANFRADFHAQRAAAILEEALGLPGF